MAFRFCATCGKVAKGKCCTTSRSVGKTTQRGYGYDWRQVRQQHITDDPLCEDCLKIGIARPVEEVHHVIPIADRPELRLERSNLVSLCKECHAKRHNG